MISRTLHRLRGDAVLPRTVAIVDKLHADGLSYRKIAVELASRGHRTGSGKAHVASAVQKMIQAQ